jgi:membrane protein YdbS with pleckstrin-like domain
MALESEGWEQLDQNVRSLWLAQAGITTLVLLVILLPIDIFALGSIDEYPLPKGLVGGVLPLLIGGFSAVMANRQFECARYRLTDEDLAYAYGVFWKSRRFVPRGRIQHVDVKAGPIARALGLVELSVYVGGQPTAAITIPGLSPEIGESMRQLLLRRHGDRELGVAPADVEISPPPTQPLA